MASFTLTVNGARKTVDVSADTPLLWVLRDTLGLTGTKYGCGIGQCSACAVHVDGTVARSCRVTIADAANKGVTTIEGLSPSTANTIQQAWIAEQVPQCGYCQLGQIMGAAALLAKTPKPTDADIDAAMDTHICRCGTYERVRRAIHRSAGTVRTEGGR